MTIDIIAITWRDQTMVYTIKELSDSYYSCTIDRYNGKDLEYSKDEFYNRLDGIYRNIMNSELLNDRVQLVYVR